MTPQEAIELFKRRIRVLKQTKKASKRSAIYAMEMAIKALEKQIPKKPTLHHFYEDETDYSYHKCANRCHEYCQVNNPQDNFCRKCGQAIDWSDTE